MTQSFPIPLNSFLVEKEKELNETVMVDVEQKTPVIKTSFLNQNKDSLGIAFENIHKDHCEVPNIGENVEIINEELLAEINEYDGNNSTTNRNPEEGVNLAAEEYIYS